MPNPSLLSKATTFLVVAFLFLNNPESQLTD